MFKEAAALRDPLGAFQGELCSTVCYTGWIQESTLKWSIQTWRRRQLKIRHNNTAELEEGLCKTRVLKIPPKGKDSSSFREGVYNLIQSLQAGGGVGLCVYVEIIR